jgi:hypothetical protein
VHPPPPPARADISIMMGSTQSALCVYSVVWTSKYLDFVDPDLDNLILKIEHTVQTYLHSSLVCINKPYTKVICKLSKKKIRLKLDFLQGLDPGPDPDPDKSLRFHNIASSHRRKYCITSTANE